MHRLEFSAGSRLQLHSLTFNRFAYKLHADPVFAIFAVSIRVLCLLCFGILNDVILSIDMHCHRLSVAEAHVFMILYVLHALMMRVTD